MIGHMPYLDQWANDFNLFADQVGDLGNLWEASGIPARADNVIYYQTPVNSGFQLAATYLPEEENEDTQSMLIKASYKTDKLQLYLAYNTLGKGADLPDDHRSIAFTAAYHFDGVSLGDGQSECNIGGLTGNDRNRFYLASSVEVGDHSKIKRQYASTSSDINETDAVQVALGYDYTMMDNEKMAALASMVEVMVTKSCQC
ncbi:MAG: porin [Psychrobium sp.]|nr:porin [Psychrobium sp.]